MFKNLVAVQNKITYMMQLLILAALHMKEINDMIFQIKSQ